MSISKRPSSELTDYTNRTPQRVLHVIQRMRPGGVQTAVMNLYRHIDRDQLQFDFAVRSQQPEYYDEEIRELEGRLFRLPWRNGNPFSLVTYKRALAAVLQESGPFIALHSHAGLYSGHILPVARQANIPLRLAHSHSTSAGCPGCTRCGPAPTGAGTSRCGATTRSPPRRG
jgi:hypothetical protein